MALVTLPLALSAILDHLVLDRGVVAALHEIADRQHDQLDPTQELRITLWQSAVPLNEFLDAHEASELDSYKTLARRAEARFDHLDRELASSPSLRELLRGARQEYVVADGLATDIASRCTTAGTSDCIDLADRFDGLIASADAKLGALHLRLDQAIKADEAAVRETYERSLWVAAVGGIVSLVFMLVGVVGIGRILVGNLERLIEGARKFAGGDREHRIEVQVPPELRRVADEFNRMIARIDESEAALAAEARNDALTGLANRRSFDEAMRTAFARTRRLNEPALLLVLDVDHFKKVNDTHGHPVGDEVLRGVGKVLISTIREVDRAFRIGGEEFAVLLAGTDIPGAQLVAERVRTAIAASSIRTGAIEVSVTASIGIAVAARDAKPADLLAAADAALYEAKSTGRDRVVVAAAVGSPP